MNPSPLTRYGSRRDTGRWEFLVIPPETDSETAPPLLVVRRGRSRITATAGGLTAVARLHVAEST